MQQIGIDVANLDEFAALLPVESVSSDRSYLKGAACTVTSASVDAVRDYLETYDVPAAIAAEFTPIPSALGGWRGQAIIEAGETVAVSAYLAPRSVDAPARALVHVRPDHVYCETFADHLIDLQCQEACRAGPLTIDLQSIAGQSVVRRSAILRGFLPIPRTDALIKVALGCPVTDKTWMAIARQTRRRTGLRLPEIPPDAEAIQSGLVVQSPNGKPIRVRLSSLEDALGPTLLIWPGRDGVIVPIARTYADDLLGTGNQFPLFGSPEAAFLTRRTYFNSPRTAAMMCPGAPILFYELKRTGGRGAIVAAARIVDTMVCAKQQVPDHLLRRAVIEDFEPLSTSRDLLATSFDNLLRFPSPVLLETLRMLGAEGSANLQTITTLPSAKLSAILELGWSRA